MEKIIHVKDGKAEIEGMLRIPEEPRGLVLFVHGSGSSRFSPRNNFVAQELHRRGLATVLIDLLTREEEEVYMTRFNIDLLVQRLVSVMVWLSRHEETKALPLGLFGSSTGAAAALETAGIEKEKIKAVVSRGGRPDLAEDILPEVACPVLLIVGGNDFGVIDLNRLAYDKLFCEKELKIVPHATHLFEEPGCLEEVARLAGEWFEKYL